MLKVSDIREFIRLVNETNIHELHIETDELKLLIKKADAPHAVADGARAQAAGESSAPVAAPAAVHGAAAQTAEDTDAAAPADSSGAVVKSPMVGTFYRAPAPTAPAYVEVGAKVTEKTVVCIVEAMKLMNEIEADVRGEIVEVLAENGQLVEYGQPLFRVKLA
ncbi:MAG: acetyl-CoA carboxylase biotin carboxyl carrier protein [Bacilli bacterium]